MRGILIGLALVWHACSLEAADPIQISPEEIGRLLGSPAGRLEQITEAAKSTAPPVSHRLLQTMTFGIEKKRAFRVRIWLTVGHGFWITEWREQTKAEFPARYEKVMAAIRTGNSALTESDLRAASPRLFTFGEAVHGVAGQIGGGPGGDAYVFSVGIPELGSDLAVMLDTPRGELAGLTDEQAEWLGRLESQFPDRFAPLAGKLVSQLTGKEVLPKEISWSEASKQPEPKTPKTRALPSPVPSVAPDTKPVPATNSSSETRGQPWLFYLGMIAATVIAWIFLRAKCR